MIDEREIREMLQRRADTVPAAPADTPTAVRRARRRLALNGALATAAVVAIAVATLAGADVIRTAPVPADTPAPAPGVMRRNGEVLDFTGVTEPTVPDGDLKTPGDLVAVDPRTGEERVLLEDLVVYSARWSADGRWIAYETDATDGAGRELWVAGGSQAPRVVAKGANPVANPDPQDELAWMWSPTGAVLATIEYSETWRTIDVATGETTDLGPIGDARAWAWSPDGSRSVFATVGAPDDVNDALYSVDVQSGERSLLTRLPEEAAPTLIDTILWSPDGTSIAVGTNGGDHVGYLYVMDADGSDIRVVADDSNSFGFAWSPDGTRLAFGSETERGVRIRVATMDGAPPAEIGTDGLSDCYRTSWGGEFRCSVTWSPDGSQVAFRIGETGQVTVFDAAGSGEGEPLDELTYFSWDGGWYTDWRDQPL